MILLIKWKNIKHLQTKKTTSEAVFKANTSSNFSTLRVLRVVRGIVYFFVTALFSNICKPVMPAGSGNRYGGRSR